MSLGVDILKSRRFRSGGKATATSHHPRPHDLHMCISDMLFMYMIMLYHWRAGRQIHPGAGAPLNGPSGMRQSISLQMRKSERPLTKLQSCECYHLQRYHTAVYLYTFLLIRSLHKTWCFYRASYVVREVCHKRVSYRGNVWASCNRPRHCYSHVHSWIALSTLSICGRISVGWYGRVMIER